MARRRSKWDDDDDDLREEEEFDFGDDDEDDNDDDVADDADDDDDVAAASADKAETAEVEEKEPAEPEEPDPATLPPDNQDAIAALRDVGARVDINDQGRVWRIFLYEKNRDPDAAQIHGFPLLKEIWLLGSRVTPPFVEKLRAAFPKAKVYA